METLAKSDPPLSLKIHIDDCLVILRQLQHLFPGVEKQLGVNNFWDLLKAAVIFHDLGKAHTEFQKLLAGENNKWNGQRHELFSIPFVDAYEQNCSYTQILKLVIVGHHKSFDLLYRDYISKTYIANNEIGGLGMLPSLDNEDKSFVNEFIGNVDVLAVIDILKQFEIEIQEPQPSEINILVKNYLHKPTTLDLSNYWLLLLLFGALKLCDHLGSARITDIPKLDVESFRFLDILRDKLVKKNLDLYFHQKQCSEVKGNLILNAPTGSGKTESAVLWLRNNISTMGQGRAFYILPFTASINAMYERLTKDIDTTNNTTNTVGMMHGKLNAYLNNYFEDYQYSVSEKKEKINEIRKKFQSILPPLKIVTPFQLLKNLFGLKGFEQGIFEWVGGYFIFDEIHAYNPHVFAQIKVLLEVATQHLKSKVLIMTATLPAFLKNEIQEAIGEYENVCASDELYNNFKRHQVILHSGLLRMSYSLIENDLSSGKKVLVVCNTVKESQDVFNYFKIKSPDINKLLLHGSFNAVDRNYLEQELIKGESEDYSNHKIMLLIGTQAIEVSLDIDFDVVYTEPAPLDALIQRFGRVNRKMTKGICPCIVFRENNDNDYFIYSQNAIKRTLEVLERNKVDNEGIIDEKLLQSLIDVIYPNWDQKSKDEFDQTYQNLKEALKDLSPLLHSKIKEEEFYKQFDGIKILPQNLRPDFEMYLKKFDFISAENLKVPIRKRIFSAWIQNDFIRKSNYTLAKDKIGNLMQIDFYETNKKYDRDIGLLFNQHEEWKNYDFL